MATKNLNVVDRGSFFDDAFFQDAWLDFDRAMQQVLTKFDNKKVEEESGSRHERHDAYRQIRANKINDDLYASQALQVTEKDGKFQVVMDVKDFNPRELQVKAVDDRVVVEGRYEKISEDGTSSSTKAFYKEFTLPPDADMDLVSTAMSKDGILTVKAPKKDGAQTPTSLRSNNASTSSVQESSFSEQSTSDKSKTSSVKSTTSRTVIQSSSSFDSMSDALESLPREIRERLMFSETGGAPSSPTPSSYRASSCSSPAPSEASVASDTSRVSTTMEFDIGKRAPMQRSEVTFNVGAATNKPTGPAPSPGPAPPPPPPPPPSAAAPAAPAPPAYAHPHAPAPAPAPSFGSVTTGSGVTSSVNVTEENGRKVLTSQTSNVVQEKDGFMEHHETAAEITEKDNQTARREASTRIARKEEDPEGRFKRSETQDASDVSESCVTQLGDGSTMTMTKSSTSSSSVKQSFSSSAGGDMGAFFDRDFSNFGDLKGLMGRGHSLMSQMSTDSMASTLSGRSNFSDRTNFSDFSDMSSRFSDMSRFSNMSSMSNMSDMSNLTGRSNMSNFSNVSSMPGNSHISRSSFSSSSSMKKSSFSSSFGDDGNF